MASGRESGPVNRSGTAVHSRPFSAGLASVCMVPALAISNDDWAGRAILERYLSGGGDWVIRNDSRWTQYMSAQALLRSEIEKQLELTFADTWASPSAGLSMSFEKQFHADMDNGEGIVGYQYLHGSESSVGDFQMKGVARLDTWDSSSSIGYLTVKAEFTWNDRIDPNPKYATDIWKSRYATLCTLGRAKDYRIKIIWTEEVMYQWKQSKHLLVRSIRNSLLKQSSTKKL